MTSIQTVLFDAAGTLFQLRQSVGQGYSEIGNQFGLRLDPRETGELFMKCWKAMPDPYPSAEPDPERSWWLDLVTQVLTQSGAAVPDGYFEALWDFYGHGAAWKLYPETREVLEEIQDPGFRMILITNFDARIFPILKELDLARFFGENVVTSAQARCRKPQRGIFDQAVALAGPGSILHVGDDPEADWEGAENAGLEVFRLNRPQNSLRDLTPRLKRPRNH